MDHNQIYHRKKVLTLFMLCAFAFVLLTGRLTYLCVWEAEYYAQKATQLHERERSIKAARGRILDRHGEVLADNKTVCTVSVIYSQIEDPELVIETLSRELNLTREFVRKRVEKYSSMERIASNVSKELGDAIRKLDMAGVKVDEDYKRYYPHGSLASKVLGFTGADNQGIIGLEVKYEEYLKGKPGTILTITDAKGIEVAERGERRIEPQKGQDLRISMDLNIQSYANQLANQALATKEAESVSVLVMGVKTGEMLAMVNVPEFDLNNPFELVLAEGEEITPEEKQERLNRQWRNGCINDTYEPGSTFKIITAAVGLETRAVSLNSGFHCPGYVVVDDRKIRCHKVGGHGSQDFVHCMMNSCNPALVTVGLRVGVDAYYDFFERCMLKQKTGIDLPGEAGTIMHKKEDMGNVELATVSFGQSFQITPIQLLTTVASIVNDGTRVTPHFAIATGTREGELLHTFSYPVSGPVVDGETSEKMREILEMVVSEGGGKNAAIEGFRIGGKTATSQTLPRNSGRYIASFIGFAPADDPQVIALAIINTPKGMYYGGQIAAPIVRQLFENILPYLEKIEYTN